VTRHQKSDNACPVSMHGPPSGRRAVQRCSAVLLALVALLAHAAVVPSGAHAAALRSSVHPMSSEQPVYAAPSTGARVMGRVWNRERVRLHCYDTDSRGRLFAYVEYHVDRAPGRFKRGFVLDAALRTGTTKRLPNIKFRNCPAPLLQPGAALPRPTVSRGAPATPATIDCWDGRMEATVRNLARMALLTGSTRLQWCARPDGVIVSMDVLDKNTTIRNTLLVTDPTSAEVVLANTVQLGRSTEVLVRADFSAARSWTFTGGATATAGRAGLGGSVEASATIQPGRIGAYYLLHLRRGHWTVTPR